MDKRKLIEILLQLRTESVRANALSDDATIKELMHKYDMLFLGAKLNTIYTNELCHSLKTKFDIDINIDDLNKMIPEICSALKMKFEPLINVKDIGDPNRPIACYSIELH